MIRIYKCALSVAAALATTVALNPPVFATTITPHEVARFPSAAEVAALCARVDANYPVGELVISELGDGLHTAPIPADLSNPFHYITLGVLIAGDEVTDDSTPFQSTGTQGWEAVVAGTNKPNSAANVYCYENYDTTHDSGFKAPGGVTPEKLGIYWSRGPCLLPSQLHINNACFAYNGIPAGYDPNNYPGTLGSDDALNPNKQSAHYLQEHLNEPAQPINICGCPFFNGSEVEERVATFCTSDSCPPLQGVDVTEFSAQSSAHVGTNSCTCMDFGFGAGPTCWTDAECKALK